MASGVKATDAINIRNKLEVIINQELQTHGFLSKQTFDAIMEWGFGRPDRNSEKEIAAATKKAFYCLEKEQIELAALELTKLSGVGISRASKILGVSNQNKLGIYDSRTAHGLSDLKCMQKRLIPIPPGQVIDGDTDLGHVEFCAAYQLYNWVLGYFKRLAINHEDLSTHFSRVADIEIAFFSRSRAGLIMPEDKNSLIRNLETLFHTEMLSLYDKWISECNYNAIIVIKLLSKHEGVSAAKILLRGQGLSRGFLKLKAL